MGKLSATERRRRVKKSEDAVKAILKAGTAENKDGTVRVNVEKVSDFMVQEGRVLGKSAFVGSEDKGKTRSFFKEEERRSQLGSTPSSRTKLAGAFDNSPLESKRKKVKIS